MSVEENHPRELWHPSYYDYPGRYLGRSMRVSRWNGPVPLLHGFLSVPGAKFLCADSTALAHELFHLSYDG